MCSSFSARHFVGRASDSLDTACQAVFQRADKICQLLEGEERLHREFTRGRKTGDAKIRSSILGGSRSEQSRVETTHCPRTLTTSYSDATSILEAGHAAESTVEKMNRLLATLEKADKSAVDTQGPTTADATSLTGALYTAEAPSAEFLENLPPTTRSHPRSRPVVSCVNDVRASKESVRGSSVSDVETRQAMTVTLTERTSVPKESPKTAPPSQPASILLRSTFSSRDNMTGQDRSACSDINQTLTMGAYERVKEIDYEYLLSKNEQTKTALPAKVVVTRLHNGFVRIRKQLSDVNGGRLLMVEADCRGDEATNVKINGNAY